MTETSNIEALLRDLAGAYVNHPSDLRIVSQARDDGSRYWAMKGNPEDTGMLVGASGSHVDALEMLVEQLGAAAGKKWTFRLITDDMPRRRPEGKHRDALEHDPRPAREILVRILEELLEGEFAVEVGPGTGPVRNLTFTFTVRVKAADDYRRLTIAPRADGFAIVSALGTLFRAISKKAGARYQIDVVQ